MCCGSGNRAGHPNYRTDDSPATLEFGINLLGTRKELRALGPTKTCTPLLETELRVESNKDNKDLANLNVLVVEDEPAIAMGIADQMEKAGASVVGPCSTVGGAMAALDESRIDVAIVDYVLADDNSESLQDALEEKGVPFLVITGYPRVLVRRSRRQPVLSKPVAPEVLAATLRSLSRADGSG
jgi:CheY-like chemotaxis protein